MMFENWLNQKYRFVARVAAEKLRINALSLSIFLVLQKQLICRIIVVLIVVWGTENLL